MPARLAVGLGLESGLETGYPASCAPSPISWGIWFSRTRFQEGNRISAATEESKSQLRPLVKPLQMLYFIVNVNSGGNPSIIL
jgi:hypothetical protein